MPKQDSEQKNKKMCGEMRWGGGKKNERSNKKGSEKKERKLENEEASKCVTITKNRTSKNRNE